MSNINPKDAENKKGSAELNENELNDVSGGMGIKHGSKPGTHSVNSQAPKGTPGRAVSENPNRHGNSTSDDNVMSDEAKASKNQTSSHR